VSKVTAVNSDQVEINKAFAALGAPPGTRTCCLPVPSARQHARAPLGRLGHERMLAGGVEGPALPGHRRPESAGAAPAQVWLAIPVDLWLPRTSVPRQPQVSVIVRILPSA
jgi:hypothetical protein